MLSKGTHYIISMKFLWEENKNHLLKKDQEISFEAIVLSIENKQIVSVIEHPN